MIPMQTKHEEIRCKYTNLILYIGLLHVFFFFVQRKTAPLYPAFSLQPNPRVATIKSCFSFSKYYLAMNKVI